MNLAIVAAEKNSKNVVAHSFLDRKAIFPRRRVLLGNNYSGRSYFIVTRDNSVSLIVSSDPKNISYIIDGQGVPYKSDQDRFTSQRGSH